MSSAQPPSQPPNNPEKAPEATASGSNPAPAGSDATMDTAPDQPAEETWADIPEDVIALTTDEILTRGRLLDNDIKVCTICYDSVNCN
jgi:26S proteasome regulatory subunit T5